MKSAESLLNPEILGCDCDEEAEVANVTAVASPTVATPAVATGVPAIDVTGAEADSVDDYSTTDSDDSDCDWQDTDEEELVIDGSPAKRKKGERLTPRKLEGVRVIDVTKTCSELDNDELDVFYSLMVRAEYETFDGAKMAVVATRPGNGTKRIYVRMPKRGKATSTQSWRRQVAVKIRATVGRLPRVMGSNTVSTKN